MVRGRRRRDPAIGKDRSAAAEDRSVPVGAGVDADLVALLMGESPGFQMVRAAYGRHRVDGLRSAWRPWARFCRYHDADPMLPQDRLVAGFVEARAVAGHAFATIRSSLMCVAHVVDHRWAVTPSTVVGHRHLTDLWSAGEFDPGVARAPLLSVGEVKGITAAAGERPRSNRFGAGVAALLAARDRFVVALIYSAALRPDEVTWMGLGDIAVRDDGVDMVLPQTKTGFWQRHRVDGDVGDVLEAARLYLSLREGVSPDPDGPLLVDSRGGHGRPDTPAVGYALRAAAAAAGVSAFSPYSLRRSRTMHAWLLGADARWLRLLLRHTSEGVYTRYVEPLHALMDDKAARRRFLDPSVPELGPVPVERVRGTGVGRRAVRGTFAGGPLEDLLAGIDVDGLRVPVSLADVDGASLAAGRSTYKRFSEWADRVGEDPADPHPDALLEWAGEELLADKTVSTVRRAVRAVEIGFVLATGEGFMPGASLTADALRGAAIRDAGRTKSPMSREATTADMAVLLDRAVPPLSVSWAEAVLTTVARARVVRVVRVGEVDGDAVVEVLADGRPGMLSEGPGTVVCPVEAARVLRDAGVEEVRGSPDWSEVFRLAGPTSSAMVEDLVLRLLWATGGRRSDLGRSRMAGYDPDQPGGVAIWLEASKSKPATTVRPVLLWIDADDDPYDAIAALEGWVRWWPYDDGPLLPAAPGGTRAARGSTKPLGKDGVGRVVADRVTDAVGRGLIEPGLSSHGFRYALAGRLHEDRVCPEVIQVRLGHTDVSTTIGYCQRWNPFLGTDLDPLMDQVAVDLDENVS